MGSVIRSILGFGRGYNEDTEEAIREAQDHARGEIELEDGYVPQGIDLRNGIPENNRWNVRQTSEFRSELEHMILEGMDVNGLEAVVNILANGGILPRRYMDRQLRGARRGTHECHIQPDMMLTYSVDGEGLILLGIETRSHP